MIYRRIRNGVQSDDWTIVVTVPGAHGKRITRTFRGTKRDAERREADLVAAVEAARWAEIDRTKLRAVVTLQQIADEWIKLGLPKPGGRPRTPAQAERLKPFLKTALTWWGPKSPAGIGPKDFEAFGSWKREHARSGTGERAADLEVVAIHNLCAWAVSTGRLDSDPFAQRPTYRAAEDVKHCPEAMPADDDELHRLIGHLLAVGGDSAVVGAHLMFQAMTGLRPGEPGALRWDAQGDQPGTRLTLRRDGAETTVMRVQRCKAGLNPAVRIHPALESFLTAWRKYTATHWPTSPWMFPDPAAPNTPLVPFGQVVDSCLGRRLNAAASALGLPPRKPHSMRAYYVRVRRSQGIEDATIAVELGQRSGPSLIVSTYGERLAILGGDGLYDWLPAAAPVAWTLLEAPANVVAMPAA